MLAYLPLANAQAKKYIGKITKDEAESAAYLGLAIAMRSWNPDKGALPSWIRLYTKMTLIREVNRQTLIKIPQELAPKKRIVKQLIQEGKDMEYIKKSTKLTKQQIDNLTNSPSVQVWLDDENNLVEPVSKTESSSTLERLLSVLSTEELMVICTKFNLDYYGHIYTLAELKDKLKMTDYEIKFFEMNALKKLKMYNDEGVFTYTSD